MFSRSDYPVHGKPHSVGKLTIIQMQIFLSGNRSGRGLPEQFFVNGGRHTGIYRVFPKTYMTIVLNKEVMVSIYETPESKNTQHQQFS